MTVLVISGTIVPTAAADGVDQQKQRVQQIADQLDALENRIGQLDEDHAAALDKIDALNVEISDAQAHIDAQNVVLAQLQGQLTSIAVDRFTSGGSTDLTPLFTTASQFSEDLQRQELSRVALSQGTGTSDELVDLLSSLADEQQALEGKKAQQAALAQTLAQKQQEGDALTVQFQQQYDAAKAELGNLIEQEQERRAAAAVAQAQAAYAAQQRAAAAVQPRGGGSSGGGSSGGGSSGAGPSGAGSSGDGSSNGGSNGGSSSGSTSTGGTSSGGGGGAAGADTSGASSGSGTSTSDPAPSVPAPASTAGIAVNAAYGQLGVTYKFAAESPGVAFDCSGLTKWAWGQAGVYLPHQSGAQYASTPHVPKEDAQPGDLIFYKSPIGHVAIYIGGGQMIHAPATGDVVKVSTVNWSRVVGVSRPG